MLKTLGVRQENIIVCDRHGVLRNDREAPMDKYKSQYARDTELATLRKFWSVLTHLGLPVPGMIDQEDVANMADRPVIFALATQHPKSCQN